MMATVRSPMINLYSRDLALSVSFYADLGFVETFRTPVSGPPEHVELELDGFKLGVATVDAARGHGLRPEGDGVGLRSSSGPTTRMLASSR